MIALEQARQQLESLGLKQAVEVLDNTLDTAASKQLTYPEMLAQLLGAEVAARRERYLSTRTKMATLEQFDFPWLGVPITNTPVGCAADFVAFSISDSYSAEPFAKASGGSTVSFLWALIITKLRYASGKAFQSFPSISTWT